MRAGETLFAAGEATDVCATLIDGALKVTRFDAEGHETILALVHPAGFVGELFQPFSDFDVVALTECRLCVFADRDFDAAIAAHPELARALLRRTQEELHASRAMQSLVMAGSGKARVAALLWKFAESASDSPCHPAARFELPLSRGEMADMLGLTIETVSRQLTALEQEGAIRREGKRGIELLDPARLSHLFD
nr:Crp/Fnr family transcriptional regulator [Parapontixanthobacter aurantiacus]